MLNLATTLNSRIVDTDKVLGLHGISPIRESGLLYHHPTFGPSKRFAPFQCIYVHVHSTAWLVSGSIQQAALVLKHRPQVVRGSRASTRNIPEENWIPNKLVAPTVPKRARGNQLAAKQAVACRPSPLLIRGSNRGS